MNKIFAAALMVYLISNTCSESPVKLVWKESHSKGIHEIKTLDLDMSGEYEIYALAYDPKRTNVIAYSQNGRILESTVIPRYAVAEYGDEDTTIATVADLEGNRYLDLLSGTQIRVASINNHRLYRAERIREDDKPGLYNDFRWMVKETGFITSIHVIGGEQKRILTSSVDNKIRVYNASGGLTFNVTLPVSVWDVYPVNADEDEKIEYLAAAYQGLYLIDDDGVTLWHAPGKTRYSHAHAADLNADGRLEYVGQDEEGVKAFDESGQLLWKYGMSEANTLGSLPIYESNMSYLLVGTGTDIIFLGADGSVSGVQSLDERVHCFESTRREYSSMLYVGAGDGIYAFETDKEKYLSSRANSYYDRALRLYEQEKFNESAYYAGMSEKLYQEIMQSENHTKALQLEMLSETLYEAEKILTEAKKLFDEKKYDESIVFIKKAQQIYDRVGYIKGLDKAHELEVTGLEQSEKMIEDAENRREAQDLYRIAEAYFVNGSSTKSLEYATKALEKYEAIGDEQGIRLSQKLIELNQGYDDVPQTTTSTLAEEDTTTTTTLANERINKITEDDIVMYLALFGVVIVLGYMAYSRIRG